MWMCVYMYMYKLEYMYMYTCRLLGPLENDRLSHFSLGRVLNYYNITFTSLLG